MSMNPQLREVHRAEIKRRMNHYVDSRWDGLYGAFGASVVLVGVGVRFSLIPRPGAYYISAILFLLGALFFGAYLWLLKTMQSKENTFVWLTPAEQFIIAVPLGFAIAMHSIPVELIASLMLLAGIFATWRLWKKAGPMWRIYFFRAGRDYFREVKSYGRRK
jgi:hypothetical protein